MYRRYRQEGGRGRYVGYDARFFHPQMEDSTSHAMMMGDAFQEPQYDQDLSFEERAQGAVAKKQGFIANVERQLAVEKEMGIERDITERTYTVPGCPEEPETSAQVVVFTPSFKLRKKERYRVVFYLTGGGLTVCYPQMNNFSALCNECHCIAVAPIYRTVFEGQYPAAINDIHAAYKWMIEHADELNIDADNVVVAGISSGAHLAASACFRLKRYGYNPRGCVLEFPILEDRPVYESMRLADTGWNGEWATNSNKAYLGNEACSPFLGPEAFANRATVEECKGYPPTFIHTGELDCQVDPCHAFAMKLQSAGVFTEFHQYGGMEHGSVANLSGGVNELGNRYYGMYYGNIRDCFKYDLRRSFLWEE